MPDTSWFDCERPRIAGAIRQACAQRHQVEAGGDCSARSRPPLRAASACTTSYEVVFYWQHQLAANEGKKEHAARALQPSRLYPKTHRLRPENALWPNTSRLTFRAVPGCRGNPSVRSHPERRTDNSPGYFRSPLASDRERFSGMFGWSAQRHQPSTAGGTARTVSAETVTARTIIPASFGRHPPQSDTSPSSPGGFAYAPFPQPLPIERHHRLQPLPYHRPQTNRRQHLHLAHQRQQVLLKIIRVGTQPI